MAVFFYDWDAYDITYAGTESWPSVWTHVVPAGLIIVKDLLLGIVMVT